LSTKIFSNKPALCQCKGQFFCKNLKKLQRLNKKSVLQFTESVDVFAKGALQTALEIGEK